MVVYQGSFPQHRFAECKAYSLGARQNFDESILSAIIPRFKSVEKTPLNVDRLGIDYIVTLRDGSTLTIDAKTRKPGAKRFWKGEPELCLERYSVVEEKKVGWLFKKSTTHPDYILYTFDRSDTNKYYLLPYMLLRKAAYVNWKEWEKRYGVKTQPNESYGGYTSDAVFVPADVVISAISEQMTGVA